MLSEESPKSHNVFLEDPEVLQTPPKIESRLTRCKSNLQFRLNKDDFHTEKKHNKAEDLLVGNPEFICSEFIKKDLKDVLDLSRCNLAN